MEKEGAIAGEKNDEQGRIYSKAIHHALVLMSSNPL